MSKLKKINEFLSIVFFVCLVVYILSTIFVNTPSFANITQIIFLVMILVAVDMYRARVYGSLFVAFDMPLIISSFFIINDGIFPAVTAYTITLTISALLDKNDLGIRHIKLVGRQTFPLIIAGVIYTLFSSYYSNTMLLVFLTLSTYAILNHYILHLNVYAHTKTKLTSIINLSWALTFYIVQFMGILAIIELHQAFLNNGLLLSISGVILGYVLCIACILKLNGAMDIGKNKKIYKESLNYFIETNNYGFIALDKRNNILAFNDKILEIANTTSKNVIGKPVTEIFPNTFLGRYIDSCQGIQDFVDHYFDSETDKYYSLNYLKIESENRPLKDKLVSSIILIKDATEEMAKQEEESIRNKLESLEQLAAGTANEMKNPLTVALGFLQLARQNVEKGELERDTLLYYLDNIDESLKQTDTSLERLTITANSSLNKARLKWINMSKLLQDLIKQYQVRFPNIDFKLNAPELKALVEPRLINICLNYIMENAVEAIMEKEGAGKLDIQGCIKGNDIKIEIIDDGVGIEKDKYLKIFDPYFTTKDNNNHGLGLYYCNCIINKLKGNIEVISKLNQGTKVIITLPVDLNDKLN
ncbi:ATP-binding protein [Proteinivorax hydrogeniformans]|uniref:histidine kinase n=1 Tax=Proteinivorax hydrogeniformans TaxID=1826727 RepID=A0AAU8HWX3_9FIRM